MRTSTIERVPVWMGCGGATDYGVFPANHVQTIAITPLDTKKAELTQAAKDEEMAYLKSQIEALNEQCAEMEELRASKQQSEEEKEQRAIKSKAAQVFILACLCLCLLACLFLMKLAN